MFGSKSGSPHCDERFAQLFEQHRPRLLKQVALRLNGRLQRRVDPDDVLQEVYLAASRRWPEWERSQDVPFIVWLRSLMLQTLHGTYRFHVSTQQRSVLAEELMASSPDSSHSGMHLLARTTSPSEKVVRREALDTLQQVLLGLSEADQSVISLRNFEELSNTEAACVLGITAKAASIRYIRALDRLRRAMGVCGLEEPGATK